MRIPPNIDPAYDQLRPPIVRAVGSTPTERYLALLADRTFLDLWSYPSPFRDQKSGANPEGKELCDLLVICDPHVIIFSEKNIAWPDSNIGVAWPRWYRKAVQASANQMRGAERWIDQFPDKIFLDRRCTRPLPLSLPPADRRITHRVLVARGAEHACKEYFLGGLGTFFIQPALAGPDHLSQPFCVGDVDPSGDFIHVLDAAGLDLVLGELDTISDFTRYLDRRAAFLRSGHLGSAPGEEELLGYYLARLGPDGQHEFSPPKSKQWSEHEVINLDGSHYRGLLNEPQYVAKKRADEVSYAWDRLIEAFTTHLLGGTSLVLPGHEYSLQKSEVGLRQMALESRFHRRGLSEALADALRKGAERDTFFRAVLSSPDHPNGTAFFFLTLKYEKWMDEKGGYEQYRLMRTHYLSTYAEALLMKHDALDRVVGVAMEPPNQGQGSSEDICFGEQRAWSHDDRERNREACEALGIMKTMKVRAFHSEEYPSGARPRPPQRPFTGLNRKQRRRRDALKGK